MVRYGTLRTVALMVLVMASLQTTASPAGGDASGALVAKSSTENDLFPLTFIHLNDFHARFEETNTLSTRCKPDDGDVCIGGYARVVTKVKSLLEQYREQNPIYLNAGDNFQGTLWYTLLRWNVTAQFLNLLPADVMTLGNHEFEHGIAGLVPFLDAIDSPVVVCNIDDQEEPSMAGRYRKSLVLQRGGRDIGVIGVIHHQTNLMGMTERLRFRDEVTALREEIERLKADGVTHFVVLSHCGLQIDRDIAEQLPDVDLIVGGHSHTFLYNGSSEAFPDAAADTYPVRVDHDDGRITLIVQAASYAKYVGRITVQFDEAGNIVQWEGNPEFLDSSVPQDPEVQQLLIPWRQQVDIEANRSVGTTNVLLSKGECNYGECNFGSFIADGYVDYYASTRKSTDVWTDVAIGLNTGGGMRTSLRAGHLTYDDLVTAVPFEDTIDTMDLQGRYLLEALEHSASRYGGPEMMQVSGLLVVYDIRRPVGSRVTSVSVRCRECSVPRYEPLDPERIYRIATGTYIRNGGSGYTMIAENANNVQVGPVDIMVFELYVRKMSPIMQGLDGRIRTIV